MGSSFVSWDVTHPVLEVPLSKGQDVAPLSRRNRIMLNHEYVGHTLMLRDYM